MTFHQDGAERVLGIAEPVLPNLEHLLATCAPDRAGIRLHGTPGLAALLVAPGSHRLGRIAEPDIAPVVARCGTATCLARRGDIWAYATSILHASAASTGYRHRRVLQIDYAAPPLDPPLEWLGI